MDSTPKFYVNLVVKIQSNGNIKLHRVLNLYIKYDFKIW
jgi:hypothetical protein